MAYSSVWQQTPPWTPLENRVVPGSTILGGEEQARSRRIEGRHEGIGGAKGQANTLIIRERDAKVPTDLGGAIYLELTNRADISPIETKLRD
jgi:hypothetical protein